MRALLLLLCFPLVASAEDPPHLAAAKRREVKTIEATVTSVRGPRVEEYRLELDYPKHRLFRTNDLRSPEVTVGYNGELDWAMALLANDLPTCILEPHRPDSNPTGISLEGLAWVYRTLEVPKLRAAEWVETERTETLDGVECRVFATPTTPTKNNVRAWLDPQRDWLPLKIAFEDRAGKVIRETTFSLDRQNRLASWTNSTFQTSGPKTENYKVESLKLNGIIPPERFEYSFPPGATVVDGRGLKTRHWIVGPDGSFQNPPFCILPQLPLGWPQYTLATVLGISLLIFVFGTCWMTAYIVAAIWKRIRRKRRVGVSIGEPTGEPTALAVGGVEYPGPPTAHAVGSPDCT